MKKLTLILVLLCLSAILKAQNINLYGLYGYHPDSIPGNVKMLYTKVNPYSSSIYTIDTLIGVKGIVLGSSTYNQSNNTYIFVGPDITYTNKVYIIDTMGNIISSTIIPEIEYFFELQYDLQNQIMYGFKNDTSTNNLNFVSLNSNFNFTSINSVNNYIDGIVGATSTFNSNSSKYIFVGYDLNNNRRLYSINAQNGLIESDPLINNCYLSELEYDNKLNKLYGFYRDTSNVFLSYFAEIDTLSADVTILDTLNEINSIVVGTSVYDQYTGYFIFRGTDTSMVSRLYIINSYTGQIISNSPIDENILEIECDNTNFAKNFYNTSSITEEKSTLYNLTIYPNPSKGTFQLSFYVEKSENIIIQIINDLGQNVCKQEHKKFKGNYNKEIDISSFKNGIYMLNIKVGENTYTKNISVMR